MKRRKKKHFGFRELDELRAEITQLGLEEHIPLSEDMSPLHRKVTIGPLTAGNSLGIHPMEGCDGTLDGKPDELTIRRWARFGAGGVKLIWGEATAILDEGRANTRQLLINEANVPDLARMLEITRDVHRQAFGSNEDLVIGLQLTHSGRYSHAKPLIASRQPLVDRVTFIDKKTHTPIPEDYPILSDDYLERMEDLYVEAAELAASAGFDFIDLKQCHTYLLSELLSAKTRPGKYGGCFENRTRFIRNIVGKIHARLGDRILLASRLNVYDGIPYFQDEETAEGKPFEPPIPYRWGFGVDEDDPHAMDLAEPIQLVGLLKEWGVQMLNVTMGSPYFNPHVGRPFERPPIDGYETPEHPLYGVARHFQATTAIQRAYPDLTILGTGYSWLQRFLVNAAAANIEQERVTIAAVGRGALAYPDYAKDVLETGEMDTKKVCVAVSYCTALMRAKGNELGQYPTGCVPRDEIYVPYYRESLKALKAKKA